MRFVGIALVGLLLVACTTQRDFIPNARRDYRACTTYETCIFLVHNVVTRNWVKPTSEQDQSLRVVLTVKLDEGARIMGVSVARSSGNMVFDESATAAVYRTGDFQELLGLDPAIFNRNFRLFNLDFNSAK
jgi:TonB family protein